jgi:hypothetical protein
VPCSTSGALARQRNRGTARKGDCGADDLGSAKVADAVAELLCRL